VGCELQEMFHGANQAFLHGSRLSHGRAYEALSRHGSDALKKAYLAQVTDGSWTARGLDRAPLRHRPRHCLRTKAS